jgi:hypothetical protein
MSGQTIFQSAGQALHVSFLMEIMPPIQRVSTQVLIANLLEQSGKTELRIASTINTFGMSPLEFRGQCALVVAAAKNHLPAPEYDAVRCRFGHNKTKVSGVVALADYMLPTTGMGNVFAVQALIWRHYHRGRQRASGRFSLDAVARQTGVGLRALRRCADIVKSAGDALEARADARMTDHFRSKGLIPTQEEL